MERSTLVRANSTILESQAATRPIPGKGSSEATGGVAEEGGEVTDTSIIIQLDGLTSVSPGHQSSQSGPQGLDVARDLWLLRPPLGIELAEEELAALLLVHFADGAGCSTQGVERTQEAPIRLVAPAHVSGSPPARRPERVETPMVTDPRVGVRLDR